MDALGTDSVTAQREEATAEATEVHRSKADSPVAAEEISDSEVATTTAAEEAEGNKQRNSIFALIPHSRNQAHGPVVPSASASGTLPEYFFSYFQLREQKFKKKCNRTQ